METVDPRSRLTALAAARGDSLAALSAMIGRNPAYLQQFVTRGSPRRLADDDRRRLADYFGVDEVELGAEPGRRPFVLPRLDIAASAGPGAFVDGEIVLGAAAIDPALASRLGLRDGQAAIVRVRGDSMEPGLVDGDLIVVDRARRTPDARGAVFVVRIDDAVMVKRVRRGRGKPMVTSDNPAAAAVPEGAVEVIGRVVWLMREPR
ncbi:phage repressor protein C with HTH and peptisase S24 domain [Sphingomonas insulae]|uniref:Peptidase S24/S26A/S26B/S26C domain-containing protein n=1 Tax=Sphingomonas insulae TaxID=424800 RepID=A0ABP3T6P6_9SPHN|nr:S24 family peptidase [Sphingomonas insulae]NIJ29597.1 phage repressor protein C with HTH and peptisase S24 domain [Sphingomonas insulae]